MSRNGDQNELNIKTVLNEVEHLLKEGKNNQEILKYARDKYTDDNIVDAIMENFASRKKKSEQVATVFMDAFQRKYSNDFFTMSLSKFMKRAIKYKQRYEL